MHTTSRPRWSILYRGSLSSCNYACDYCPFAKTRNSRAELAQDAAELDRFVEWVRAQTDHDIGILMTPWGEGLIRGSYREAMCTLSQMPHVRRVAIQTNLSFKSDAWFARADLGSLALWTTWHPTQITREAFVSRALALREQGVRFSVGVVGLRDAFDQIERLREELPGDIYLWVNAYKRERHYYSEQDIARIERVDPLFRYNARRHPSLGRACQAGHTSFTVDGRGDVRRCHFIEDVLGNIHSSHMDEILKPRACTMTRCGCHIGYIHLDELGLYEVFGDGLMERIPHGELWRDVVRRHEHVQLARSCVGTGPLPEG